MNYNRESSRLFFFGPSTITLILAGMLSKMILLSSFRYVTKYCPSLFRSSTTTKIFTFYKKLQECGRIDVVTEGVNISESCALVVIAGSG